MHWIQDLRSDRTVPLATRHFLMQLRLHLSLDTSTPMPPRSLERMRVPDNDAKQDYQQGFCNAVGAPAFTLTLDQHARTIRTAMQSASEELLNTSARKPRRPWISQATLDLLTGRDRFRAAGSPEKETDLTKRIRASVKEDKRRQVGGRSMGSSAWAPEGASQKASANTQHCRASGG